MISAPNRLGRKPRICPTMSFTGLRPSICRASMIWGRKSSQIEVVDGIGQRRGQGDLLHLVAGLVAELLVDLESPEQVGHHHPQDARHRPGDGGEHRRREDLGQEAHDLREEGVDGLGDDGQAEALEHRHQHEEHDQPVDELRPTPASIGHARRLAAGDLRRELVVELGLVEDLLCAHRDALGYDPAHDQDGERLQDRYSVRRTQLDELVVVEIHHSTPFDRRRNRGFQRARRHPEPLLCTDTKPRVCPEVMRAAKALSMELAEIGAVRPTPRLVTHDSAASKGAPRPGYWTKVTLLISRSVVAPASAACLSSAAGRSLEDHLADAVRHVEHLRHRGAAEKPGSAALVAAHALIEHLVPVDIGIEPGLAEHRLGVGGRAPAVAGRARGPGAGPSRS